LRLDAEDSSQLEVSLLSGTTAAPAPPACPPVTALLLRVFPSEAANDVGVLLADITTAEEFSRAEDGAVSPSELKLEGRLPLISELEATAEAAAAI
jgi:hypothetical protein